MTVRVLDRYRNEAVPALKQRFQYKNVHAIPKLLKIVISMGIGDAEQDQAKLDAASAQLGQISGQRPIVTLAKKSVSNFKLREGNKVGLKVTLRGARMYEFFDRLISLG